MGKDMIKYRWYVSAFIVNQKWKTKICNVGKFYQYLTIKTKVKKIRTKFLRN